MILATATAASRQYGYSYMRAAVQSRQVTERSSANPRNELEKYINGALEDVENVVAWWGVSDQLLIHVS